VLIGVSRSEDTAHVRGWTCSGALLGKLLRSTSVCKQLGDPQGEGGEGSPELSFLGRTLNEE